jgi:hypothetical protein
MTAGNLRGDPSLTRVRIVKKAAFEPVLVSNCSPSGIVAPKRREPTYESVTKSSGARLATPAIESRSLLIVSSRNVRCKKCEALRRKVVVSGLIDLFLRVDRKLRCSTAQASRTQNQPALRSIRDRYLPSSCTGSRSPTSSNKRVAICEEKGKEMQNDRKFNHESAKLNQAKPSAPDERPTSRAYSIDTSFQASTQYCR